MRSCLLCVDFRFHGRWSPQPKVHLLHCSAVILHLGQDNGQYQYRLGDEGIAGTPAEKDLRVLMRERLSRSWQCSFAPQKASSVLGCITSSMGSRVREGILLLCSDKIPTAVLCPALRPSAQKIMELLEQIQRRPPGW